MSGTAERPGRGCLTTARVVLLAVGQAPAGPAGGRLDPGDQAALLGHAAQALAGGHRGPVDAALPAGATARMYCRPLPGQDQRRPAGGVVHVKLIAPTGKLAAGTGSPWRRLMPGLAGSGPLWLRSCDQADAAMAAGRWLALEGEPGAGKLALLRAICRRRNPAGTFRVLDADDASGHDWLPAPGDLPGGGGAWSSGTPSGSAPRGCERCGQRLRRRWPRARRRRCGLPLRSARAR